jgi:hypothetical protein
VWEYSLLGGLNTNPNKGGFDPIWKSELIIDKLLTQLFPHVPIRTGLLKPLSLLMSSDRFLDCNLSMSKEEREL